MPHQYRRVVVSSNNSLQPTALYTGHLIYSGMGAPPQEAAPEKTGFLGRISKSLRRRSSAGSKTSTLSNDASTNPFADADADPSIPPPEYSPMPTAASGPSVNPQSLQIGAGQSRDSLVSTATSRASRYQNGAHPALTRAQASTDNDPYAFLSSFDTVFVIDDSASMVGNSWDETAKALAGILPVCTAHDEDGVDLYFLNHRNERDPGEPRLGRAGSGYRSLKSPRDVTKIFNTVRPRGCTPTGRRLNEILGPYLRYYKAQVEATGDETCLKPLNVIVVTDGMATDDPASTLEQVAKRLDKIDAPPYQVGVQFFQVGNDNQASEMLRQLDEDLGQHIPGGVRDIVDTVSVPKRARTGARGLTKDEILKTVLGAVNKRLDRLGEGTA